MTDQAEPIDRLREDFREVVRDRKAKGQWTDDDEAEVGRLIKSIIDGRGEVGLLECWAAWLSTEAEQIRQWRSRVRDVEARMHASACEKRQKECA